MLTTDDSPARSTRLRYWQIRTLALLVVGYSGYYLCRSNLSVCLPFLNGELEAQGLDASAAKIQLGSMIAIGTLAYALGKFVSGALGDFLGGRRNFLGGMSGAVLFTALFATGNGMPLFTVAWLGNRLVQSLGWVGMVKIAGRWFSFTSYGTVLAVLSLSYLFGDAASRAFLGLLVRSGFDWRAIFAICAASLGAFLVLCLLTLKESPLEIGEPEGAVNPANLFGSGSPIGAPGGILELVRPLLKSAGFGYACLLSLTMTLLRETFNTWTPTYFTEAVGLDPASAAFYSGSFSFLGGCSVILAGWIGDWFGRGGRAGIILIGLFITGICLICLGWIRPAEDVFWAVALVALTGFWLIGPYSYLSGAIALDFGGSQGSATASGIIDGVGYLAGVLAGDTVARVVAGYGWSRAFTLLGILSLLSCLIALFFLRDQRKTGVG